MAVIRPRYVNVPGEPTWARPDRVIADAMWRARRDWAGARIIHGHYSVTGLAAWHLAAHASLPFVLTFHGSDINRWPDEHPERLSDLREAVAHAGAVFAVSQALADRIREVTGIRATYLPLGSDHRAIAAGALPRSEARALVGLPQDSLVALYVGELKRSQGGARVRRCSSRTRWAAGRRPGGRWTRAGLRHGPRRGLPNALNIVALSRTKTSFATCRRLTFLSCRRMARGFQRCWSRPGRWAFRSSPAPLVGFPSSSGPTGDGCSPRSLRLQSRLP